MGRCKAKYKCTWGLAGAHAVNMLSGSMRASVHLKTRGKKQQYVLPAKFSARRVAGRLSGVAEIPSDQGHGLARKPTDVFLLYRRMQESVEACEQIVSAGL